MIKNTKFQAVIKIGIGFILLFSVILGYYKIPRYMNEYTCFSNFTESVTLIYSGALLLYKQKHIPTFIDLCLVILAFIMLGICVTNYDSFRFDGAFLFLHVLNPVLVFMHWIFITEKGKIKSPKYVLTVFILPAMYIGFLFIYGHISKNYIYPVFDINVLGTLHVTIFILVIAIVFLAVAYTLYFIDKAIGTK